MTGQAQMPEKLVLHPDRSIADQVLRLADAVLVPARRQRTPWVVEAGLFDQAGQPVSLAQGWHSATNRATRFPPFPAQVSERRDGRYLFLGHYHPQFGHFLLETTARLWHLHHAPDSYDGAIVLHQPGADLARIKDMLGRFMALCGWKMPPLLKADGPLRLGQVVVPVQGCGALTLMAATPEYRAMIHDRFAADIAPKGHRKIYISRTGLDHPHGSLIEEDRLEQLLRAEGFVPYHPQHHSMEDQIAQYKAAEVIAGVDGSAFHLVALVVRAHQRVVMFQRRPAPEVFLQAGQLTRFGAGQVAVINARPMGWSPAGVRRSALSVFGVADFPQAGRQLADLGLIADPGPWTETPREELRSRLRAIGARLGADMYEVQRPGESLADLPLRSHPRRIRLYPRRRWRGND